MGGVRIHTRNAQPKLGLERKNERYADNDKGLSSGRSQNSFMTWFIRGNSVCRGVLRRFDTEVVSDILSFVCPTGYKTVNPTKTFDDADSEQGNRCAFGKKEGLTRARDIYRQHDEWRCRKYQEEQALPLFGNKAFINS